MKTACALCRVQTCFDKLFLISYFKMYQILSESNNCRKSFAICQIKILSVSFHLRLSLFVITTVNVNICFHKSKQKRENISQAAIQTQSKLHHEPNRDTSRKIFRLHCTMLHAGIYNLRKRSFRCRPGMYAIFARDVRHPCRRWRTSPPGWKTARKLTRISMKTSPEYLARKDVCVILQLYFKFAQTV